MVILIFIAALIIRIAVQYHLGSFVAPQMWEYEEVANNFLSGKGFIFQVSGVNYYSFVSPLYSVICIIVYFLTKHSFIVMMLLQAALSSFTCVVIFLIGKQIFGRKTGLLSASIVAIHPSFIVYTTKLHPFVFDSFFICLTVWLLLKLRHFYNFLNQIMLGLTFGLGILTRSTLLFFLPFSLMWLKKPLRRSYFVFVLATVITISPWLIRNYTIHKKIILLTSAANLFWRGNNPIASGTAFSVSGKPVLEDAKDVAALVYGKPELEQNRIFWNESIKFIKTQPLKFVVLNIKKLFYFWWFAPSTGIEYKIEWFEIYLVFYVPIVIFFILGLLGLKNLTAESKYDTHILLIAMLSIAVAQSLFYVETRHRWAIEPLIIVIASYGIMRLINYYRGLS